MSKFVRAAMTTILPASLLASMNSVSGHGLAEAAATPIAADEMRLIPPHRLGKHRFEHVNRFEPRGRARQS